MEPIGIARRVKRVDILNKYREEIHDIDALTYAALCLTEGVNLTPDPDDIEDAEESIAVATTLMRIARRQLHYLRAELADDIARTDVMTDDEAPPSSTPPASA